MEGESQANRATCHGPWTWAQLVKASEDVCLWHDSDGKCQHVLCAKVPLRQVAASDRTAAAQVSGKKLLTVVESTCCFLAAQS
jgi:hypothetical protein